jgi:hypothetical protein
VLDVKNFDSEKNFTEIWYIHTEWLVGPIEMVKGVR